VQKAVEGPPWEWGTADEAVRWLNVSRAAWDGLVEAGLIPPPAYFSRKSEFWHWQTVYAVSVLLPFLLREAAERRSADVPPKG
jgi:hypothetical protein